MINKKNLDRSFDAIYTLRKRNLFNQTSKEKKIQFYSSSEMALTRAGGLDSILAVPRSLDTLIPWIVSNNSSLQTYIPPGPITRDFQGNFYIGALYNTGNTGMIVKVDPNGKYLDRYDTPVGLVSLYNTGGWPWGLAFDDRYLYASDMTKHVIHRLDLSTRIFTPILGLSGTSGYVNGTGASTRLFSPVTIIADNIDNCLYFNQGDNFLISKYVISTGVLSTFAGTGVRGFADGPGTSAQFNINTGLFFDNSGHIIVCDSENHRLRRINKFTQVVTTIVGTGVAGNLDGPVASAIINEPTSGCCDSNGNFYISVYANTDPGNFSRSIIKISNGIVSTIYSPGNGLPLDNDVTHINFHQGYVYVTEQNKQTMYRFAV